MIPRDRLDPISFVISQLSAAKKYPDILRNRGNAQKGEEKMCLRNKK